MWISFVQFHQAAVTLCRDRYARIDGESMGTARLQLVGLRSTDTFPARFDDQRRDLAPG
jgi:hypothetical protein